MLNQQMKKQVGSVHQQKSEDMNRRVVTEMEEMDQEMKTLQDISNLKAHLKMNQIVKQPFRKNKDEPITSFQVAKFENQLKQIQQQTIKQQIRKPLSIEKNSAKSVLMPTSTERHDYTNFTYTNLKVVGSGSFGVVHKAKVNETGEFVAIKKVLQDRRYKNRELQILQELDHVNVLKMKHAFYTPAENKDESYLHVVMEYFPDTLYSFNKSFIKDFKKMPDVLVKLFSYQLLRSIAYISLLGICHRDIKPHNVLVNPESNKLQLCDFGSAKKLIKGEPNIAYICSRCYRAPELIFGATDYDTQVDVWSVGCVIAELINGEPLFLGDSAVDQMVEIVKVLGTPTKEQILSMNRDYDVLSNQFAKIKQRKWNKVLKTKDTKAIDLVSKLLTFCPKTRLTPFQSLAHPYFDELRDIGQLKSLQNQMKISIPELFNFSNEEMCRMTQQEMIQLIPDWYGISSKIVKTEC
ncbi:unnamed protein product (macronuclear) [Paramecium tetraurelia]|uniref:Protein kinase domain-containing protein n=1 Tax=Paramecium tetraurelia TaxID=5888 RepID=A0D237_PARTE|nr:uncharacterized protein GSPATT00012610001 [Paramecium tetraurelia]CAK77104.1 unnamed protein product [Paramecium tetraurelia]|eukprot:XP_001444501.1 hypothetical protein (macronuclear) [Paramecium tetraurelia strain d4-2]